jgi:ribosomal protein L7/L12
MNGERDPRRDAMHLTKVKRSTMNDQTVISAAALQAALSDMSTVETQALVGSIVRAEPELGPYLQGMAVQVAGQLALSGAPPEVCQGVHEDLLRTCALTYFAFRKGSYEIWSGTALGQRLKELEVGPGPIASPAPEPKPAARATATPELGVVLIGIRPGHKRAVIRTLRQLTGQSYRETRPLLDHLPAVVMRGITVEQAATITTALLQAGAVAVVQPTPTNETSSED